MNTQKLTPTQKKVYDCLLAGNTMDYATSLGAYQASNGEKFKESVVDKMLDSDILRIKYERMKGFAASFKTIVIA